MWSMNEGFGELRILMELDVLADSHRATLFALMCRGWEHDAKRYDLGINCSKLALLLQNMGNLPGAKSLLERAIITQEEVNPIHFWPATRDD